MNVCMYACMYTVCIYVFMCVYVYVCVCVCKHSSGHNPINQKLPTTWIIYDHRDKAEICNVTHKLCTDNT